jgi:hypothetical protein
VPDVASATASLSDIRKNTTRVHVGMLGRWHSVLGFVSVSHVLLVEQDYFKIKTIILGFRSLVLFVILARPVVMFRCAQSDVKSFSLFSLENKPYLY